MTTSLGLVDAFEKAAQIRRNRSRGLRDLSLFSPVAAVDDGFSSSVVGNRDAATGGSTPSVRVTRDMRAEGSTTHKKEEPAGYPADRRVTLGGAQCACVANAPVAQLPLVSEPVCIGLGQMSSVGGESRSEHAAPVVLTVGGPTLDSLPLVVHEAPGVSGSAVHVGHVTARAVTDGGPRLGEAS